MSSADRARVHRLSGRLRRVRVVDFVRDLPSQVLATDAVVSMGGYNSVCTLLSSARPAVIVPGSNRAASS